MRFLSSITVACLLTTPLAAQLGPASGPLSNPIGSGRGSSGQSDFGASTADRTGGVRNQTIGTLRNGSRFERGARRNGNFVGSDRRDQRSFVGAVQGATNPAGVSSVTGIRSTSGPTAASVNQARQPSAATASYDPTLIIAFDVPQVTSECVEQEFNCRLAQLSGLEECQVSVQLVGQTAVIRGSVLTDDQRRCVELYLQMEPGITSVDNRLQVTDSAELLLHSLEPEFQESGDPIDLRGLVLPETGASNFEQPRFGRPLTELFSAPLRN